MQGKLRAGSTFASEGGRSRLSRESIAVFGRSQERLHHLRIVKIAVEGVQLIEPEAVATEVGVAARVGISLQVSEVLH